MMGPSPDRTNHFSSGTGDTESRYKEDRLVRSGFFLGTLACIEHPTSDVKILHLITRKY